MWGCGELSHVRLLPAPLSYMAFIGMPMADTRTPAENRRMLAAFSLPWMCLSAACSGWTRRRWLSLMSAAAAFSALAAGAATFPPNASPDQDIAVHVQQAGAEILVTVDCPVRAPVAIVWEVLTDYDTMASFISNLQFSGVERRVDNHLTVRQTGKVNRGLLSFSFDNVREIELLPPTEIRSKLVRGDMKASAFTTRIVEVAGVVHIENSGRYTPSVWVPPLLGPALIEGETRKQYAEIRAEIVRRARGAAGVAWNADGTALDVRR